MRPWHIICLFLAFTPSACVRSDLAPGVNPDAIKAVQLGMDVAEVIRTLGMPLSVEALNGVHMNDCPGLTKPRGRAVSSLDQIRSFLDGTFSAQPCCSANRRELEERHFVLIYSRMVDDKGISPMLWIHFNEQAQVREVFAKLNSRVAFRDDIGIYLLKWPQVKGSTARDTTTVRHICNEELLEEYFSQ